MVPIYCGTAAKAASAPHIDYSQYQVNLPTIIRYGEPTPEIEIKIQDTEVMLQGQYGGTWQVLSWDMYRDTPRWIYGTPVKKAEAIASETLLWPLAQQVIQENQEVLRVDPAQLQMDAAPNGMGKWVAHFQQYWNGYEVWQGKVRLVFHENGNLVAMASDFYNDINIDPQPNLSPSSAGAAGLFGLNFQVGLGDSYDVEQELLILPIAHADTSVSHHLTYRVNISTSDPLAQWVAYVDAHSGDVLWRYNNIHFDYMGKAESVVRNSTYCNDDTLSTASYLNISVSGVGETASDIDGDWWINGGPPFATVTSSLNGPYVTVEVASPGVNAYYEGQATADEEYVINWDDSNSGLDERIVFNAVNKVHNYFLDIDPDFEYINNPIHAEVQFSGGSCPGNAWWWSPSPEYPNGRMVFCAEGLQGADLYANTGEIETIVLHEYGHGIQGALVGPWQGWEGVGEGNADHLANLITQESKMGVGEIKDDCLSYGRDSFNDLTYQFVSEYNPDVFVHLWGQVLAGFHWDLMNLMQNDYGTEDGAKYSAELWHYARKLWQPMSQAEQLFAIYIADDNNGDLTDGTPHYAHIVQASNKRGYTSLVPLSRHPNMQLNVIKSYEGREVELLVEVDASFMAPYYERVSCELHYTVDGGPEQTLDVLQYPYIPETSYKLNLGHYPGGTSIELRLEAAYWDGVLQHLVEYSYPWDNSTIPVNVIHPGPVHVWGDDGSNQCNIPEPNKDFIKIAAGNGHCLGLKADGTIAAWGDNSFGQCNVPIEWQGDFINIAAGGSHSIGISEGGAVVSWGNNIEGQLELESGGIPVWVDAGEFHSILVDHYGVVYTSGDNSHGQSNDLQIVRCPSVGAGWNHSLAILSKYNRIFAWGKNDAGQCNAPMNPGFTKVGGGENHSLGLTREGVVYAWGDTISEHHIVPSNYDYIDIAAGAWHNLALKEDGTLIAWGDNTYGQCNVPELGEGQKYVSIAAGEGHSLAIVNSTKKQITLLNKSSDTDLDYTGQPYSAVGFDYHNEIVGEYEDLLITQYSDYAELYLCYGLTQEGVPQFTRKTYEAFGSAPYDMRGCSVADVDNDGNLDLFLAGGMDRQAMLWRNTGAGSFIDESSLLNLTPTDLLAVNAGAWADYDGDGLVDIYLCRGGGISGEWYPDFLLRNSPADTGFVDVTLSSGIGNNSANLTNSIMAAWGDVTGNGKLDLFVTSAAQIALGAPPYTPNSKLFIHDNSVFGGFTEETSMRFDCVLTQTLMQQTSIDVADVNRDGKADIVIGCMGLDYDGLVLMNNGSGSFYEQDFVALNPGGGYGLTGGVRFADMNLDGELEILTVREDAGGSQAYYVKAGNGYLEETSSVFPPGDMGGPAGGMVVLDWNRDGLKDLYLGREISTDSYYYLAKRDSLDVSSKPFVSLKLISESGVNNAAGIGARVEVPYQGSTLVKWVDGGSGRGGQRGLVLEFPVDWVGGTVPVTILWPNGWMQQEDVPVHQPGELPFIVYDKTPPNIKTRSVQHLVIYDPLEDESTLRIQWETEYKTDIEKDRITLHNISGGCDLPYTEITYTTSGATFAMQKVANGCFKHTVSFSLGDCVPGCGFQYMVHSGHGEMTQDGPLKSVSTPSCPSQ